MKQGGYSGYGIFREGLKGKCIEPVTWSWDQTTRHLESRLGAELRGIGLVALSRDDTLSGCEVIPGISCSVQSLAPNSETPRHAHAWWHVFVVQGGTGLVIFGENRKQLRVGLNDIVFIPAWCTHELLNEEREPFVTLNLSNMPQQSDLANFRPG
jgi:gentisate 1,2-dioxygenase